MLDKTKIALSAAIVLGTALTAQAATNPRSGHTGGSSVSDVIPGYDKDGRTVGVPNPDKADVRSNHS